MCSPEVTATSLHPPRLCRLAVFSMKPTLLSIQPTPHQYINPSSIQMHFQQSLRPSSPLHACAPHFHILWSLADIVINIIMQTIIKQTIIIQTIVSPASNILSQRRGIQTNVLTILMTVSTVTPPHLTASLWVSVYACSGRRLIYLSVLYALVVVWR